MVLFEEIGCSEVRFDCEWGGLWDGNWPGVERGFEGRGKLVSCELWVHWDIQMSIQFSFDFWLFTSPESYGQWIDYHFVIVRLYVLIHHIWFAFLD